MERTFEKNMKIGDIASTYPGAIETFLNYKIDFCCMTFQKTYDKLVEIEQDLFNHIHLENNILFPRLKN